MINKLVQIIFIVAVLLSTGCSKRVTESIIEVNKPTATTTTAASVANYLQSDWQSFKSGGSAKVDAAGKSLSSSMQMRMQRGQSIYISLRPVMGIEVAKMVISGDSIMLVDKVHKRYMLEKASLLTNGIPVTVDILQDIFLGRAFELGKGSLTSAIRDDFTVEAQENGNVVLKPREQFQGFDYKFVYDKNRNLLSLDVTPTKQGASTYSVHYDDIKASVAGKVPSSLSLSTALRGKAFTLELEYKDMKWNEEFTIDTVAPKKYTRITGGDILQMLGVGK